MLIIDMLLKLAELRGIQQNIIASQRNLEILRRDLVTYKSLSENIADYIVYEIDGGIRACASLHVYDESQAEIAGIAVDSSFSNLGIGPKLIEYLISRARAQHLKSVFILTTQTSDWFEHLGFTADSVESLPQERRSIWTPERNSKVFRLKI